jgi:hypothetical protein
MMLSSDITNKLPNLKQLVFVNGNPNVQVRMNEVSHCLIQVQNSKINQNVLIQLFYN